MRTNRIASACCIFLLILSLILMAGCGAKRIQIKEITSSQLSQQKAQIVGVISATELNSIAKYGDISIADDSYASHYWIPKFQKNTLPKIMSWLQHAKLYKGKIPNSFSAIFSANIGPSTLFIAVPGKHQITIKPVYNFVKSNKYKWVRICYVAGVLKLDNDKKTSYIQSNGLYNWLKKDKWKSEFHLR